MLNARCLGVFGLLPQTAWRRPDEHSLAKHEEISKKHEEISTHEMAT